MLMHVISGNTIITSFEHTVVLEPEAVVGAFKCLYWLIKREKAHHTNYPGETFSWGCSCRCIWDTWFTSSYASWQHCTLKTSYTNREVLFLCGFWHSSWRMDLFQGASGLWSTKGNLRHFHYQITLSWTLYCVTDIILNLLRTRHSWPYCQNCPQKSLGLCIQQ